MSRYVAAAAALALLLHPAAAGADEHLSEFADQVAVGWVEEQDENGLFVDYVRGKHARGYGPLMIGYGLMRAGARRDDARLVARGVRAVDTALLKPPRSRGVFDTLAVSTAYNFARHELARDPAFRTARGRWEEYLRTIPPPVLYPTIQACILEPGCYQNHESVEAAANLELLATGLRSAVPGTKLGDGAGTRAAALRLIGDEAPAALHSRGRSSAPVRGGLGVFPDVDRYPLAYHALSTAMLAHGVRSLGSRAPAAARAALRRGAGSLAAFMGPDGDVAFIGRRQQQSWALAAAAYSGEVAAAVFRRDRAEAERYRAMAARALARLERVHGLGPSGVNVAPRLRASSRNYRGIDGGNSTVVWNGLTIFLLNAAADASDGAPPAGSRIAADRDGFFQDPVARFATVRRGPVWFAVNARPEQPDLRYDFGLVALKLRGRDGRWRDLVRPRPMTEKGIPDSAGPVLLRDGRRWLPRGGPIAVRRNGTVLVAGGYATAEGEPLPGGAVFAFRPLRNGVKVSFRAREGDRVLLRTFLPADNARRRRRRALDRVSVASAAPRPGRVTLSGRYASCCDDNLVAATMQLRADRDRRVTYTVRERRGSREQAATTSGGANQDDGGAGAGWKLAAGLLLGGLLVGALAGRRRRVVARRVRRGR